MRLAVTCFGFVIRMKEKILILVEREVETFAVYSGGGI